MVGTALHFTPPLDADRGYTISDKYVLSDDAWAIRTLNFDFYDVVGRPELKLVVGRRDGSYALHSRRRGFEGTQVISSGSPGSIFIADPVTGRPPGAAVRREVEADDPVRRNRIAVADVFRLATLDGYADRDRRYLRRDAGVHSEAAHQWMHVVDTFFPGNPLIRRSQPPDGFAEIFEEDPAPVPEPEDDPDLSVPFDVVIDSSSPEPEPEKKEERQPTRFELIEF
jgi:hypothetical protein